MTDGFALKFPKQFPLTSCFIATRDDVADRRTHEEARKSKKKGATGGCAPPKTKCRKMDVGFQHLLTQKQKEYLQKYTELWRAAYGEDPKGNDRCVFDLTQDPNERPRTTKPPHYRLPCILTGSRRYWVPYLDRWLLPKELAAAMGWDAFVTPWLIIRAI